VLVTGAAGFIASHVCEALLARGERVIGLDSLDPFYARAIKERNLQSIAHHARASSFEFIEGDFCDQAFVERLLPERGVTAIIHLGARAGVRPSVEQPALYARVNVEGTAAMLEAARKSGVRRFVMASSSSVYGLNSKTPFSETDEVAHPISPYAATKRACELMAHTHHHLYGLPVACLRFFTVFGPRQRPDLAIALFMDKIARGQEMTMFGAGTTSRDYTYIDDIVAGVIASHERIEQHGYRIWNLGGSHPVTLSEMIATIGRVVGKEPRVTPGPARPGDVERTFADLTRSRAELGYEPRVLFEEGVARQWAWRKDQPW
jgi:UDP-glucuronate 4-epimerase